MSAIVERSGRIRQLDFAPQPDNRVTEDQVTDAPTLARLLMQVIASVVAIQRRFWPKHVDHEDRDVDATGTTVYRFPHGFNARVRWWPVDWSGATAGPRLVRHSSSDYNTLALVSYTAGTVTIRVEEAG